jgi:hypothetical protein
MAAMPEVMIAICEMPSLPKLIPQTAGLDRFVTVVLNRSQNDCSHFPFTDFQSSSLGPSHSFDCPYSIKGFSCPNAF